jgi:hypothetical protein
MELIHRPAGNPVDAAALRHQQDAPAMKILLLSVFGTILLVTIRQPGALSHRLAALRAWPSARNRPPHQ